MSCGCTNTVCLKIFTNDCVETVDTGLIADLTGEWDVFVEFNGMAKKISIDFINGSRIVIPNIFNTNYKHNVTILRPNGSLFNDTCYIFNMVYAIDSTEEPKLPTQTTSVNFIFKDIPNPNTGDGSVSNPYQLQAGDSVAITIFGEQEVHLPVDYNAGREYIPYNPDTNIFDRTHNGGFINNDLMTVSYEKTI